MTLTITYAELSEYIRGHHGRDVAFERVSDTEIRVTYTQKVLFASIPVPVTVRVDEVLPSAVRVTYGGPLGVDMIISGLLSFISARAPELGAALQPQPGHGLLIDLTARQESRPLTQMAALEDVRFGDAELTLRARLK